MEATTMESNEAFETITPDAATADTIPVVTREQKLAALIAERDLLSERHAEAATNALTLRQQLEDAFDEQDMTKIAALQPQVAGADELAARAQARLAPIVRQVREIRQQMDDEADAKSRQVRLDELGERLAEANTDYDSALRTLVHAARDAALGFKEAHQERLAAITDYRRQRAAAHCSATSHDAALARAEAESGNSAAHDRPALQRLAGDALLGDLLWVIAIATARPDELRGRVISGQVRSPVNFPLA